MCSEFYEAMHHLCPACINTSNASSFRREPLFSRNSVHFSANSLNVVSKPTRQPPAMLPAIPAVQIADMLDQPQSGQLGPGSLQDPPRYVVLCLNVRQVRHHSGIR